MQQAQARIELWQLSAHDLRMQSADLWHSGLVLMAGSQRLSVLPAQVLSGPKQVQQVHMHLHRYHDRFRQAELHTDLGAGSCTIV